MPATVDEALAAFGLVWGYTDQAETPADWLAALRAAVKLGAAAEQPAAVEAMLQRIPAAIDSPDDPVSMHPIITYAWAMYGAGHQAAEILFTVDPPPQVEREVIATLWPAVAEGLIRCRPDSPVGYFVKGDVATTWGHSNRCELLILRRFAPATLTHVNGCSATCGACSNRT